ncbi:hypothetical protein JHK85_009865 [Glycine max]|nr:hypothetical protein JHK85_009865 [Glycine max]
MLVEFVPFWGDSPVEIFEAVLRANLRFPTRVFCSVSPAAKDLLRRMLCKELSRRFSVEQVLSGSCTWRSLEQVQDLLDDPEDDQLPPFPSETAIAIFEEELGSLLAGVFDHFEYEPIAATSLGTSFLLNMIWSRLSRRTDRLPSLKAK